MNKKTPNQDPLKPISRPLGQPTRGYGSNRLNSSFYGKDGIRSRMNERGFASTCKSYDKPNFDSNVPAEILGLGSNENWSPKEIAIRFKMLVRQYHPDTDQNDKTLTEKLRKIIEANDVIKKDFPNGLQPQQEWLSKKFNTVKNRFWTNRQTPAQENTQPNERDYTPHAIGLGMTLLGTIKIKEEMQREKTEADAAKKAIPLFKNVKN